MQSRPDFCPCYFDLKTLDPSADGNWSFLPAAGDANVTFVSAPQAEKMLAPDSLIEPAGVAATALPSTESI